MLTAVLVIVDPSFGHVLACFDYKWPSFEPPSRSW